ncbi:MAG TPA: phosphatase PAP2 family protein [Methanospirillum sp.]|nr:phosphatase PAP2 family protein [Methanospirillum sp.]
MDLFTDTGLSEVLQTQYGWAVPVMQIISLLGSAEFYLLIIPAVFWCYDKELGYRLGILTALGGWVSDAIKLFFHLPRPYWLSSGVQILDLDKSLSFGFPSGHAQLTLTFWGMIGYWMKSVRVWLVIVFFLVLVGVSRLFLGMHFLRDISVGWIIGAGILIGFIMLEKPVTARIRGYSDTVLIGCAFIISLVMIAITASILTPLRDWVVPDSWVISGLSGILTEELSSLHTASLTSGLFFGMVLGWILIRKAPGYLIPESLDQKAIRYVLGIGVLGVFWVLASLIIPDNESVMRDLLTYVRATLAGLWIFYGAPCLFLRILKNS